VIENDGYAYMLSVIGVHALYQPVNSRTHGLLVVGDVR